MTDAFASMRARLFAGPFAFEATWRAGGTGGGVTTRLMWAAGEQRFGSFGAGVDAAARVAEALVADIAAVAEGDTFTPLAGPDSGVVFTVARATRRDHDRAIWTMEVER